MTTEVQKIIQESIAVKKAILEDQNLVSIIEEITAVLVDAFRDGKKVLLCGNGGSAADAQHIAAEFSGRFYLDRKALFAEALHVNTSYLTAVANDYGYDAVYERMVEAAAKQGDVVIGLTTSGNSKNVVRALQKANALGAFTIAFRGAKNGDVDQFSNLILGVPSNNTPRVQECHLLVGHIICELTESILFGNS